MGDEKHCEKVLCCEVLHSLIVCGHADELWDGTRYMQTAWGVSLFLCLVTFWIWRSSLHVLILYLLLLCEE